MSPLYDINSVSSLSRSRLSPSFSPSLSPCPQVSPDLALCVLQCAATGPINLLNVCCCFCCSVLFSLHFPLCPTGQGRWPSSLSLVLLEVSSVKGSFSSPLLPMACSRGICWVFSTCLYSLDFIM
ncbi:hypothetical protein Q5P01_002402 [Channa striata]|uniref:Uncharacterized protein n=1 Tax=Channa striata TaxID=64152 RepID=A0AA88NU88_CHASR|nr:hypothetical protein Q5P01_002402 [Channa striata]